ncbi:MAG: dephospho-CoA kinase [Prosthecobacter sp.]|nr:dephospho-CoA kinase [Prosthecobacter sp.]
MKSWIITGGIGCGKSSVCELMTKHLLAGAPTLFSADLEVQALFDKPEILAELCQAFGSEVVTHANGKDEVNRAWLREQVFSDSKKKSELEGILHPSVLKSLESERENQQKAGANLFLAEVPLHYEIGGTVSADLIIVVAASPEVQKRRLMERRGLDESIIEQMLRAQWPIEAKVERADVVIWNDGDRSALEAQVLTLARQHWPA